MQSFAQGSGRASREKHTMTECGQRAGAHLPGYVAENVHHVAYRMAHDCKRISAASGEARMAQLVQGVARMPLFRYSRVPTPVRRRFRLRVKKAILLATATQPAVALEVRSDLEKSTMCIAAAVPNQQRARAARMRYWNIRDDLRRDLLEPDEFPIQRASSGSLFVAFTRVEVLCVAEVFPHRLFLDAS